MTDDPINNGLIERARRRSTIQRTGKPVVFRAHDPNGRMIWRWSATNSIHRSNDLVRTVNWCDRANLG